MTRQAIGEALAVRLYAAEAAIDHAMAEAASLTAALPAARTEAWLSTVVGQRAFSGAAAAISALAEARGHLVQTHNTLAALAGTLGLEALPVGPVDKPGNTPPVGGGVCLKGNTGRNMINKSLQSIGEAC
jgi:hypothetical protein